MNSSLEKLFKMPAKQKIAIWLLALTAISLGFYFGLVKTKQTELKDLQSRLNDLQTQIQENTKIANNLQVLQREYNQLTMQLDRALTELPNQKEIPNLLTSITSAGKGAGLDFLVFKPRPEEPKDFYATVPVDISISGSYEEVARFFVAVSELPRIVNISNVVFSDFRTAGNRNNMKVTCLATTFRFLDQKEANDANKGK